MASDIYHSPYNITRKGNSDIHECTHEDRGYTKEVTIKEDTEETEHE